MSLYMLINITALLLFTPKQPTVLEFDSAIEYHALGNQGDFDTYPSQNRKILLIKPKKENFDEFLIVITKMRSYQFRLQNTPKKLNALYKIEEGRIGKLYKVKEETKDYKVLEGEASIKIIRKSKAPILINGISFDKRVNYYPKGASLFINNHQIY